MKIVRNVGWWLCFMAAGIFIQTCVNGLDVLVVGVIILLQERDYKNMLWLLPLFILLQEGMGTRLFGGTIAWYAAVALLFKIGRFLFEVENFIFVFLLSACLGCVYFGLAWLLAPLQDLTFDMQDMMDKSLLQALFIPIAWRLLMLTRQGVKPDEE